MKLENAKKPFIRSITCGKNENYLNISISRPLAGRLPLTQDNYLKIYLDNTNNLVFEKLKV